MTKTVLKSKYETQSLLREDLLTYRYVGTTHYSAIPVLIFEYKSKYLDAELVNQLIRICEKLMTIRHDHILTMLDYYYDGKGFYTIHEYHEDLETLEQYLKKDNHWDVRQLWKFCSDILSAQVTLEQAKLVSGSMTLNGIGVTKDRSIKLLTPCIAVEIFKKVWEQFPVVEDCLFYPPEFVQFQRYGIPSDIYGFGVLMYLFFSRSWPYKFTLKVDVLKKAFLDAPLPFKPISASIPSRLGAVISTCIHQDPRHRFASFVDLIRAYKGESDFHPAATQSSTAMQEALQDAFLESRRKKKVYYAKLAVAVFCFFLSIGGIYAGYLAYFEAVPEYVIPDVVGLEQADAEQLLQQHHLRSLVAGARVHPHYDKGVVIETKPPAGRMVKNNRTIRVFISKGVGSVMVPDLIGRSVEQVDVLLGERGLQVQAVQEDYSTLYRPGIVIGQVPSPNAFLGPSENILITVSKGYPVQVSIQKIKTSFFRRKDHLRHVKTTFSVLKNWPSMEVSYFFTYEGQKEKVYSDTHSPGETITLDFELELSGTLDVYFDDDLAFTQVIKDDVTPHVPPADM